MTTVRALTKDDYHQAMELHVKMGADYLLDLDQPDFIIKNGMFDGENLVTAILGRMTTEGYLLLDREWMEPQDRMNSLNSLIGVCAAEAKLYGITDTHVWIPPRAKC